MLNTRKRRFLPASPDMVNGKLFGGLLIFAIPLMLTGILQYLYNAADLVIVGRFAENGERALAAVGATGSLLNLIINSFMGLSIGASVSIAIALGAKNDKDAARLTHTSVTMALIGGVLVGGVGILFARRFLIWMDTPPEVLDAAALYMRIYFIGAPANLLYNYGAAVMRTTGDTRRPLYILAVAGLLNVLLNLLLVIVFRLSVAGVAIATVVSQTFSAVAVIFFLRRYRNSCRLYLRRLRIHLPQLKRILARGIPAGIQSSVFSLSNAMVQTAVNGLGEVAMAGCVASSNLDGFTYIVMNAYYHACMTFTGQNVGAGKRGRINRTLLYSLIHVLMIGMFVGALSAIFARPLLGIYLPNGGEAVSVGVLRLRILSLTYITCGIMEVFTGSSRGMGASVTPMLMTVIGVCGSRMLWVKLIFPLQPTILVLYLCYPVSWIVTSIAQLIGNRILFRRLDLTRRE